MYCLEALSVNQSTNEFNNLFHFYNLYSNFIHFVDSYFIRNKGVNAFLYFCLNYLDSKRLNPDCL